jgi:hypothetical protein
LAKGTITLNGCVVEKAVDEFSFSISTSTAKVYTLTCKTVRLLKLYNNLRSSQTTEVAGWVDALQKGVKLANQQGI